MWTEVPYPSTMGGEQSGQASVRGWRSCHERLHAAAPMPNGSIAWTQRLSVRKRTGQQSRQRRKSQRARDRHGPRVGDRPRLAKEPRGAGRQVRRVKVHPPNPLHLEAVALAAQIQVAPACSPPHSIPTRTFTSLTEALPKTLVDAINVCVLHHLHSFRGRRPGIA